MSSVVECDITCERASRKRKRAEVAKFTSRSRKDVNIEDIQNLLLWVLADESSKEVPGTNPDWMLVSKKHHITKVVVCVIPYVSNEDLFAHPKDFRFLAQLRRTSENFRFAPRFSLRDLERFARNEKGCPCLDHLLKYRETRRTKKAKKVPPCGVEDYVAVWKRFYNNFFEHEEFLHLHDASVMKSLVKSKNEKFLDAMDKAQHLEREQKREHANAEERERCIAEGREIPLAARLVESEEEDEVVRSPRGMANIGVDESSWLGMDCEMVQVEGGSLHLARCSLVDSIGNVVYDELCRPEVKVTDYLTAFSGMTEAKLKKGRPFMDIQAEVLQFLKHKPILIGHSIDNDMKALRIFYDRIMDCTLMYLHPAMQELVEFDGHNFSEIPDPFKNRYGLEFLVRHVLKEKMTTRVEQNQHCSVEDATYAIRLVRRKIQEGPSFFTRFDCRDFHESHVPLENLIKGTLARGDSDSSSLEIHWMKNVCNFENLGRDFGDVERTENACYAAVDNELRRIYEKLDNGNVIIVLAPYGNVQLLKNAKTDKERQLAKTTLRDTFGFINVKNDE